MSIFSRLGFFALLLSVAAACQSLPTRTPENIEFIILQINDVYEIAPLEGGKVGGLARVATIKQELLRENPNTIAVLAGDFLSPSLTGTLKGDDGDRIAGLQMVETLNAMGLDYATFGNHEFDLKDLALLQKRIDRSQFRYVSCNALQKTPDGQVRPFTQAVNGKQEPVPGFLVKEFKNQAGDAVRVALTGVVLPFNKASYVSYLPVTESFAETCRQARTQSDVIVALTHLAVEQDQELAAAVPGVSLFIGGHDHTHMNHYVENTIITKADANAKTVYIHRVSYNPASRMTRIRSSLRYVNDQIPDHPATKDVVDNWQQRTGVILRNMGYQPERPLMTVTEPLVCTEYLIRSTPTNYGELTAKAFEMAWPGADAYFLNSGSMRLDDNISGVLTEYDVLRTFPFGGDIVRTNLPGDVLEQVLLTGLTTNRGEGGYFQTLGIGLNSDKKPLLQGKPIDPKQQYSVVLPRFVAEGKEQNLGMLSKYTFEEKASFNLDGQTVRNDVRDLVIHYMLRQSKMGK